MVKRPLNHILGEIAVNKIKENLIPDEWIINEQTKDYGLDLQIQVCIEGITTGNFFFCSI